MEEINVYVPDHHPVEVVSTLQECKFLSLVQGKARIKNNITLGCQVEILDLNKIRFDTRETRDRLATKLCETVQYPGVEINLAPKENKRTNQDLVYDGCLAPSEVQLLKTDPSAAKTASLFLFCSQNDLNVAGCTDHADYALVVRRAHLKESNRKRRERAEAGEGPSEDEQVNGFWLGQFARRWCHTLMEYIGLRK
ncbi:uncharacterized protein LOC132199947 [Neocloeon triangulifer]|uniref:uncharacterized protein LOC132199947 n=1 Tax=Neocloeon triangulifer TaxID=2078957 RepID=UPI00286EE345|nr:uncharacterized protein LOC132199947 [Neocloeon triangulifer]XP_059481051.1 uncharacterized protein LOC132199947 [Neocloeon triangulifer]